MFGMPPTLLFFRSVLPVVGPLNKNVGHVTESTSQPVRRELTPGSPDVAASAAARPIEVFVQLLGVLSPAAERPSHSLGHAGIVADGIHVSGREFRVSLPKILVAIVRKSVRRGSPAREESSPKRVRLSITFWRGRRGAALGASPFSESRCRPKPDAALWFFSVRLVRFLPVCDTGEESRVLHSRLPACDFRPVPACDQPDQSA